MKYLSWALGAAHLVFGGTKLAAVPTLVAQFHAWQLPTWRMYFVGVAQTLGGVGLLIRNLRSPSSFAMGLVMVGATVTLLATGQERANVPLTLVLSVACFAVAAHRLPQLARELVADGERAAGRAAARAPTVDDALKTRSPDPSGQPGSSRAKRTRRGTRYGATRGAARSSTRVPARGRVTPGRAGPRGPIHPAHRDAGTQRRCVDEAAALPPPGRLPATDRHPRCHHQAACLPPPGSTPASGGTPPASRWRPTCLRRHPACHPVAAPLPREAACLPLGGRNPAGSHDRVRRGLRYVVLTWRGAPSRRPFDATLTPRNSSPRRCRLSSVDGDAEGPGHGGAGADVAGDDQEDRPIKNITKKSQALASTSTFSAAEVARWSTQLETLTREIGAHAVPRAIPTGVARSRVGGDHVITVVLEACERHGITLPGQLSPERLRTSADETRRLRGLRTQLETLKRLVDASLAEADGTSWEGATTAYSMLRRLGDTDPALADSLAPAVAFFAPAVKKTKEKKTENKMPALAPIPRSIPRSTQPASRRPEARRERAFLFCDPEKPPRAGPRHASTHRRGGVRRRRAPTP